jgi:nicotinate-nucleotide pyrophosphorylase (carboxylating)
MKIETIAQPMVSLALTEDLGSGDVTTDGIVPEGASARGTILARSSGVLAGLDVARLAFTTAEPSLSFEPHVKDGGSLVPGQAICVIRGPARGILIAERVALNFLQRLSGVATSTRRFVEAVKGTGATILDTRKTTPGMRILEKYAVSVGGGGNHRFGLFDMYLIKDNHLKLAAGIAEAVGRCRAAVPDLPVEVEVSTIDELREACAAGVDRVMLDNMSLGEVKRACEIVREITDTAGRPKVEVSGGITLDNVREMALCGVDYISIGAITHSAPAVDMSLELEA